MNAASFGEQTTPRFFVDRSDEIKILYIIHEKLGNILKIIKYIAFIVVILLTKGKVCVIITIINSYSLLKKLLLDRIFSYSFLRKGIYQ